MQTGMQDTVLKATTQKSYYGKAHYFEYCGISVLMSYKTDVCRIIDGKFERLWSGYSKTTLNHVNDFRKLYGLSPLNKKEWLSIPCDGEMWKVIAINSLGTTTRFQTIFSSYDEAKNFVDKLWELSPFYSGSYYIKEVQNDYQ